jgi:DNA-binding transcriptional LysR family regulator
MTSGRPTSAQASWAPVELRELRVFLTLVEELHFGRAAQRLDINPSRVSQVIRELETKLGGRLFDRTSRRVRLTEFGERVRQRLEPAYSALELAVQAARLDASTSAGPLSIAFTTTTEGPALSALITEFRHRYPSCEVALHEVNAFDPYSDLRRGESDVLCHWLPVDGPDLTAGPSVAHYDVVLLVGRGHRLAGRSAVSVEDVADEELARLPSTFPTALYDIYLPPLTPSGRPIRWTRPVRTIKEILSLVAQGRIVWPAIATTMGLRDDIISIPIQDASPAVLGLIWRTADEDARIRALAWVARTLSTDAETRAKAAVIE